MTDTLLRGGYQQPPEWALSKTVVDVQRFPAIFILAWRHPFYLDEEIMQSAGSRQTGFECRIGQRRAGKVIQDALGMFQRQVLKELLRCHTSPFVEHPLEMEGAEMHMLRHRLQRGLVFEVRLVEGDCRRDPVVIECCLGCLHELAFLLQNYQAPAIRETRFLRYFRGAAPPPPRRPQINATVCASTN